MSRIQPAAPSGRPLPTGVRKTKGRLTLLAFVVVMGPGVLAYVLLKALGAPLAAAGLVGLFLMLVGAFLYPAWLFGGGHRTKKQDDA